MKHIYEEPLQKLKQSMSESIKTVSGGGIKKRSNKGLKGSIGKFKNGVLHISKNQIKSVSSSGKANRTKGTIQSGTFKAAGMGGIKQGRKKSKWGIKKTQG